LNRIGPFNEELATGEDTDFAFRAYQAGVPVLGVPAMRVVHHGEPATLAAWYRQQLWHANRRSYEHIRKLSGGRVGGNAPRFTRLYLAATLSLLTGMAGALCFRAPFWMVLCLPWIALIAAPAAILSRRGRTFRHFPGLCVLYGAYGLARTVDLLGLHPQKPSWKSAGRPAHRGP
jgi:GT2 family glycosyltransferase